VQKQSQHLCVSKRILYCTTATTHNLCCNRITLCSSEVGTKRSSAAHTHTSAALSCARRSELSRKDLLLVIVLQARIRFEPLHATTWTVVQLAPAGSHEAITNAVAVAVLRTGAMCACYLHSAVARAVESAALLWTCLAHNTANFAALLQHCAFICTSY
jgi:hypothetical protein